MAVGLQSAVLTVAVTGLLLLCLAVPSATQAPLQAPRRRLLSEDHALTADEAAPVALHYAETAGPTTEIEADPAGKVDSGEVATQAVGSMYSVLTAVPRSKYRNSSQPKVPNQFILTLANNVNVSAVTPGLTRLPYQNSTTCANATVLGQWSLETTRLSRGVKALGVQVPSGCTQVYLAYWQLHLNVMAIDDNLIMDLAFQQQTSPPWNLDRVDQIDPHNPHGVSSYSYTTNGTGAYVYIIDTGIRSTHTEFSTSATLATSRVLPGNSYPSSLNPSTTASDAHGTHIAGTVAGLTYGIAKAATIVSVKVNSDQIQVLQGLFWAIADQTVVNSRKVILIAKSVATSSLTAIDYTIDSAVQSFNITVVVAAGNNNQDACNFSPARAPSAITVSSSVRSNDAKQASANFGSCVDIYAPGENIVSASDTGNTATVTRSGTSCAAALVAGAAARIISGTECSTASNVATCVRAKLVSMAYPRPTLPSGGKILYIPFFM